MRRKSLSAVFVTTLLGLLLPSLASALGTPDGLPPPMEHICDFENGAAYGLCNAYCQAMDCDSDTPSASITACQKVANKFEQITGRPVPCSESCPLYQNDNFPIFNRLVSTPSSATSCVYGFLGDGDITDLLVYEDDANNLFSAVWTSGNEYFGSDNGPGTALELDQYESCKGLLEDAILINMLSCTGL